MRRRGSWDRCRGGGTELVFSEADDESVDADGGRRDEIDVPLIDLPPIRSESGDVGERPDVCEHREGCDSGKGRLQQAISQPGTRAHRSQS